MTTCIPSVLDEDLDYHDEDDTVKEQDGKDGAQEGTKKHCRIKDETAGGGNGTQVICLCCVLLGMSVMYCTLHSTVNDLQSLNFWCGSAYNKISADCI